MSRSERMVLAFLTVTFLVGAVIYAYRRIRLQSQADASPIVVVNPADTTLPESWPIDLNSAGKHELEALPGIGPVLAERILRYRSRNGGYGRVGQLRNVSGIGPKRYADIKDLVKVGPYEATVDSGRLGAERRDSAGRGY